MRQRRSATKEELLGGDAASVGTMLFEEGVLSGDDLRDALAEQAETGLPLRQILVDRGMVDEATMMRAVAKHLGVGFVDLDEVAIDPAAVALVPESIRRRYHILPLALEGGKLLVASSDPGNIFAADDVRAVTGHDVELVAATRSDIEDAAKRLGDFDDHVSDLAELVVADDEDEDTTSLEVAAEEAPVVKLVNGIITRAIEERASDIHVEPGEQDLRIRFRIDGVLHDIMTTARSIANALVSRVKIMADLDIAERRLPQDGRMSMRVGSKTVDLRVATLPSIHGEAVVIRILARGATVSDLGALGFLPYDLERYRSQYRRPHGAILVTGPTGSGKTTTLYSTLQEVNRPEVNVITVEDPVEYRLEGVTQIQVNRKAGLTFATALKSILRADPDIVLVGEVRDRETARIATEAALTGHLVLTTLHTNDAPSSINRLIEMGVEPFLVGSAIDAVVGQRLARRLCERCKEPYTPDPEDLARIGWDGLDDGNPPVLYRAVGCSACSRTGYRGRIAITEVMVVSEQIRRLAVEHTSSDATREVAVAEGMRTLRQDGFAKVGLGITSIEEVLRVVV